MVGCRRGWWVAWWVKGGCVVVLPVLCVVSPFCLRGGPVEWRVWRCVCCPLSCVVPSPLHVFPVFELDLAPRIVQPLLHCILSCCAARFFFVPPASSSVCVLLCLLWMGKCGGVIVSCPPFSLLPSLCLLSQHCWFRVVSLWNGDDGLCGAEGRVVSTVHCQLLCVVVCVSVWCVCCLVVLCCAVLWNGGGVRVCGLFACLPLPLRPLPLHPFCCWCSG